MKSYPYIGKSKHGHNYLFTSSNTAYSLTSKLWMPDAHQLISMKNITHEFLQNTYGEVVSPEHAEFIIELAENAKCAGVDICKGKAALYGVSGMHFNFYIDLGVLRVSFSKLKMAKSRGEKQITIPLPPKADKQESSEWPQVGDEVVAVHENNGHKGKLLALTKKYAIISQGSGEQHLHLSSWALEKPKTPEEELREWMQERIGNGMANNFDCEQITHDLLHHLDIKKKPQ